MRAAGSVLWVLSLSLVTVLTSDAGEADCGQGSVEVSIEGAGDHARLVCAGAERALRHLEACGVERPERLTIQLVETVIHPCGVAVFGLYDPARREIHLTAPPACRVTFEGVEALNALSFDEFYKSLVAHETAHAIVSAADPGKTVGKLGHEYIASVVQMSALPPEARGRLIAPYSGDAPMETNEFSLIYLAMNPHRFMLHAWRHNERRDGCAFIRKLMDGGVPFGSDLP